MAFSVSSSYSKIRSVVDSSSNDALPAPSAILKATQSIPSTLPSTGLGEAATAAHLISDIVPGFNGPKTSSNYYGFVTGGVLPIAEVADNIVTAFDQNAAVHLPDQSISTIVEDRALQMLTEMLHLGADWQGRTFTTGGTGANVLGLACGREAVISARLGKDVGGGGVGELGLLAACGKAGVKEIQVLTSMGHSSLYKAASIVGLGRAAVKDIVSSENEPWRIDIELLERELKREKDGVVSIVALSAGEVNTGMFATSGPQDMRKIRDLCEKYRAWLHVDGAFGLFARSLPHTPEFAFLMKSASSLELADSIASDCHKMLNVPYDCGFFLTRSPSTLSATFQNPNAAYLSTGPSSIPSPLNIGLENSRRFRALPVYAVLLAYGRDVLAEVFARQVRLTRVIAEYLDASDGYELLAGGKCSRMEKGENSCKESGDESRFEDMHIIVLFRAKDETVNGELVKRINATRRIYVSGTKWGGRPACRIAVSTWKAEVERDLALVKGVLEEVLK